MKNKVIILLIIMMLIIIAPASIYAYGGINENVQIGNTVAASSSVDITERILGTLQVAGSVIAIIALIIIGMRYMFSSIKEKAQMKGVLVYYIIGAILVFATSNVLGVVYNIVDDVQHMYEDVPASEGGIKLAPTCVSTGIKLRKCKDCGKVVEASIPKDPNAHSMGDWEYTKETCTTDR